MTYTVTNEGPLEVHRIEIHQVNLAAAAHRINRELYSKCRLSQSMSDHCLALALIVKAVEDEQAGVPTDEPQKPEANENSVPIAFPKNGSGE